MKRVLLVGSAPNAQVWLTSNAIPADVVVCGINNAWYLVRHRMNKWYAAGDFFSGKSQVIPKQEEFDGLFWRNGEMNLGSVVGSFLRFPYWYPSPCGGTMILNCLYDLINRYYAEKESVEIFIIGCDLVYSGNTTHFYGKGDADPLRAGTEWLTIELNNLKLKTETGVIPNVRIFNLSTGESLLPFERKGLI